MKSVLETLRNIGIRLLPIEYKIELPVEAMGFILTTEAAAAFDELTRSGDDDQLVRQFDYSWPNIFRAARFVPAVEYIQANRLRTMLIEEFHQLIKEYDVIITPSFSGTQLLTTNLTGQPVLSLPNGFADRWDPTQHLLFWAIYTKSTKSSLWPKPIRKRLILKTGIHPCLTHENRRVRFIWSP